LSQVLGRGAQAAARGANRFAPQVLDRGAQAVAHGAATPLQQEKNNSADLQRRRVNISRRFCEWEKWCKKPGVWGTLCANTGYRGGARFACNLQMRRKDASTEQPKNRATLLAFGEIGYEGGLGEVASAAVIGKSS
jgi:hypothetical protein